MRRPQSTRVIVHEGIDVKQWIASPPGVDEARPAGCPRCGRAARPLGGRLGLHGHGLRLRQVLGPVDAVSPPAMLVPICRRYECQQCAAVVIVEPRGVSPRRHYSAMAVALALALFGEGHAAAAVRREVSPFRVVGPSAAEGWASLRRWARAALRGALFARMPPFAGTLREVAAQVGQFVLAHAPPTLRAAPARVQVFAGGHAMS